MDLQVIHDHIIQLAHHAGTVIMDYYDKPIEQSTKSNAADIVTIADKETEKLIVGELLKHYPEHHIVGEEGGGQGASAESATYFWYVDPIDGTTNYASKIPHFATSIALADGDMNPLVAVVYDPSKDELFSAIRGHGAWCDGMSLQVSSATELSQSIVASGFPYTKWTDADNNLAEWGRFVTRVRGVRRTGSAALDACYVAAGRFEGYWERHINSWDITAGALLVQEAGGTVTNYSGQIPDRYLNKREILMSNGKLHQEMVKLLTYS